jgi:RHS repeat-associated protein
VAAVSQGTHALTLGYDPNHPYRVLTSTDGENRTTTFTYDEAERVKTIKLPSGHQYGYGYDADGNRTSVTMPNGRVHQYTYDALGRATGYDPTGSSNFGRAFDADGFATSLTQPGGGGQTLQRQASGRLSGVTSPDGTASSFTYAPGDGSDRLATAARTGPGGRSDETTFGYDGALVTSKESRDGGGAYASFAYGYDDRLKLKSIDLTAGADSDHQAITRDDDGFVIGQGPFTFTRNGPAGLTSAIADGKLSLALGYSATGTEKTRMTTVAGTPVFQTDVTRDKSGRITQKVEKTGNGAPVTYTYDYWPDGELKSVSGGSAESYAYDVNGNRTSANGQAATYTDDDRLNGYTYDAAGALSAHGADTYSYSDTGELLSATVNATTVTYTYDSAGRRVARTQGGQTYRYIYGDPRRPLLVTATRASDGTLTTYNYGEDDLLFSLKRNGQRFYVATDQVGTPRVVADATGAIKKQIDYDAFGVQKADSDPTFDLPIGFAGGISDPVTKLVRFGLRDYDPAAGRFTARDPIFQAGGPNVYAYTGNDPVAGRDPMGLDGWFSNAVQAVHDFFSSDKTQTAISQISQIESESQVVKAAGELSKGIDRANLTQELLDTALELKEASQEPTDPEQAAGYLKCGLKWLKKVLPLDLVGTDQAAQVLDEGMVHARNQRDTGTINGAEARQLSQIEW